MRPVTSEIELAHPLAAYRGAFERRDSFLLDGAGGPDGLARFSLFGAEPFLTFRAWRTHRRADGRMFARVVLRRGDAVTTIEDVDALEALRAVLAENAIDPPTERPLPLLAGAVGYIGYEIGQTLERLPCAARPSIGMPDIAFSFHDWILGTDHATGRSWLSTLGDAAPIRERLRAAPRELREPRSPRTLDLVHHTPRDAYLDRIADAKRRIDDGDAFEICLTHALDAPFHGDPAELFDVLRAKNPAPFAALLDLPEGAIVSSSPERFLRLDAARVAESRPIKGTRPRGTTAASDARIARELASSEKDRAENAMIVDLVRNDLGRVCKYGSVSVPELYAVEPYATVHQLVSTVRGELRADRDAIDLVRACFPPGSMTGAPKIEAMTVLEHLEPVERGPYAGALGFIGFDGTLDLSVVIRAIVVRENRARLHVGGAIVADSEPAAEHDESLLKARALVDALEASP
ncbi:MAG TPA: aminodeoxychorismate synthase component I [Labilithrix sp.]